MSIEIYDKAKTVVRDNKYYYLVKFGSKNSFTCGGQCVIDNNFDSKYLHRDNRDSHWTVVAIGSAQDYKDTNIAKTYWNSPTSEVYGQIRFGNKKNIAFYFAKSAPLDFASLSDSRQANLKGILDYGDKSDWVIDLSNIPDSRRCASPITYCGNSVLMDDSNSVDYKGFKYWSLDNL